MTYRELVELQCYQNDIDDENTILSYLHFCHLIKWELIN